MSKCPKARSEQIIVRILGHETIVYDTRAHAATCLNELAGQIWRLCDGARGLDEIATACGSADPEIVIQMLGELSKAELL